MQYTKFTGNAASGRGKSICSVQKYQIISTVCRYAYNYAYLFR